LRRRVNCAIGLSICGISYWDIKLVVRELRGVFNRRCTQINADELLKSGTLRSFCRKNSKKCDRPKHLQDKLLGPED
jgi:hypothetical protein